MQITSSIRPPYTLYISAGGAKTDASPEEIYAMQGNLKSYPIKGTPEEMVYSAAYNAAFVCASIEYPEDDAQCNRRTLALVESLKH